MSINQSEKATASTKDKASDGASSILTRHEAPLGWLIVNRPQVKNALNYEAWRGIVAAMDELNADNHARDHSRLIHFGSGHLGIP
jgi:selenophosphate synthase